MDTAISTLEILRSLPTALLVILVGISFIVLCFGWVMVIRIMLSFLLVLATSFSYHRWALRTIGGGTIWGWWTFPGEGKWSKLKTTFKSFFTMLPELDSRSGIPLWSPSGAVSGTGKSVLPSLPRIRKKSPLGRRSPNEIPDQSQQRPHLLPPSRNRGYGTSG